MCYYSIERRDYMNKQIIDSLYQETLFNVFPYNLPAFPKVTLSDATIHQLHYHKTIEIGFCYRGSGECISEMGKQSFKKGDAEFFFPFQPHLSRSSSTDKSVWDFSYFSIPEVFLGKGFEPTLWENLAEGHKGIYGIIKQNKHPEICNCIEQIISISHSNEKNKLLKCRLLIGKLLLYIVESEETNVNNDILIKHNKKVNRLLPTLIYIKENYNKPIKLQELADMCSMSISTFRENFTSAIGISPQEYLISTRMRFAKYYLENTGKTIQDICSICGFNDTANFYKQFSKRFGVSPTAYRNAYSDF